MNVAIRVDASLEIGIGHFMRCLTLADTLRKSGAQTKFLCRHITHQLHRLLVNNDHGISLLVEKDSNILESNLEHAKWLGVNQEFDAIETLKTLGSSSWDWIIVDHYALDYRWEEIVKNETAAKILVVDDLCDRRHICDIFLNQNLVTDAESLYADKLPKNAIKLIGPQYALLREEFLEARSKVKFRSGPIKSILVSFGGTDVNNVTGKVLNALPSKQELPLEVDVVIGAEHPYLDSILTLCTAKGYTCHIQTNKIAELMLKADLAIGACGSTIWEMLCLGLPALVITLADNQLMSAKKLSHLGLVKWLGHFDKLDEITLKKFLADILARPLDSAWRTRCKNILDEKGAARVAKDMINKL